MRYILFFFLFSFIIFIGCSDNEETNLEAFNPEAFAYDIGETWEVNATTRVKGFEQKEENGKFTTSLAYDINLVTPDGKTLNSLISKVEDISGSEEMTDTALEAQFELDSTYMQGKYELMFEITDVLTGRTVTSTASFNLSDDQ